MARVTGIGGVFVRCADPERSRAWYRDVLGIGPSDMESIFRFREDGADGYAVWSVFPAGTDYFSPSTDRLMVNFRVDDLDGMLQRIAAAGIALAKPVEDHDYGRFAWIVDPDGLKIELWEQRGPAPPAPKAGQPS